MVPLPVNVFCFPAPASTPRSKPNPMSRSKKGSRVPGRPDDGYHLYIRERVMADKGLSMTPCSWLRSSGSVSPPCIDGSSERRTASWRRTTNEEGRRARWTPSTTSVCGSSRSSSPQSAAQRGNGERGIAGIKGIPTILLADADEAGVERSMVQRTHAHAPKGKRAVVTGLV